MKRAAVIVGLCSLVLTGCWTQVGFGPERSSFNPFESTVTVANVASLRRAWAVDVGTGVTAPVVLGDRIAVTSTGQATSLDARTGAVLWQTDVSQNGESASLGPLTATSRHLRATFAAGPLGGQYTFDLNSGAASGSSTFHHFEVGSIAWRPDGTAAWVAGDYGSGGPFLEYLVYGGKKGLIDFGTTGVPPTTNAAIVGDQVVLGVGASVRSYPLGPCTEVPPPFPSGYCQPEWTAFTGAAARTPAGIDAQHVAVVDDAGELVVLDLSDGSVVWSASTGATGAVPPAVADGVVYVAGGDGRVHAFAADGCGAPRCDELWSGPLDAAASYQPAVAGDVVYVATASGRIDAFAAAGCGADECEPVWGAPTDRGATAGPIDGLAVASGGVYAATRDGHVVAFRLRS